MIDENGLEEEDKRLLKRLKEILGKEEKGKLFNLKYVDGGKVKRDYKIKLNREIHCHQRYHIYVHNVMQATTVLAGELLGKKESEEKVEKELY